MDKMRRPSSSRDGEDVIQLIQECVITDFALENFL